MRKKLNFWNIIIRYLLLILVALPNLWIFYAVFTPLTIYPVYTISKILFNASLSSNLIFIYGKTPIALISACIAGAAYYLLFILNITIPDIQLRKRISMIAISFLSFLILNILRIVLLIFVFISGYSFFDLAHEIFWYALSTVFVLVIWFVEIRVYKIKEIPVYSDIKQIIRNIKK